jgi:hypothetical protein
MYMPLHASAEKTKSKNAPTIRHRDTERARQRRRQKRKQLLSFSYLLASRSTINSFTTYCTTRARKFPRPDILIPTFSLSSSSVSYSPAELVLKTRATSSHRNPNHKAGSRTPVRVREDDILCYGTVV